MEKEKTAHHSTTVVEEHKSEKDRKEKPKQKFGFDTLDTLFMQVKNKMSEAAEIG